MKVAKRQFVKVDNGHRLFCIDHNPSLLGSTVLCIHGGPGGEHNPSQAEWFSSGIRIINYDQRGCGQSRPQASSEWNTTQYCIEDIEAIRTKLGIESFSIVAGSWGAALALLYCLEYPDNVESLVLYSPFLGSSGEVEYFFDASRYHLPDNWFRLTEIARGIHHPEKLIELYHDCVFGRNHEAVNEACQRWMEFEIRAGSNDEVKSLSKSLLQSGMHLRYSKISLHYFRHAFFLDDGYILSNAHKIAIECLLVHGDSDLVSNPETSTALNVAMPNSSLEIVSSAGHCGSSKTFDAVLEKLVHQTFENK